MDELTKRAQELDDIISSGISEKIDIEDAKKIMRIYGTFLEYCSVLMLFFGSNMPESLLPYKKDIIAGALTKMISYYERNGDNKKIRTINETLMMLIGFADDEEAIAALEKKVSDRDWRKTILSSLKERQREMIKNGYVVDGKIWRFKNNFES